LAATETLYLAFFVLFAGHAMAAALGAR